MALTPRQRRFVEEYLIDLNATQAAIRAGYSPNTARQQGVRMLTIVDIQDAIRIAEQDRSERTGITQDEVLQHLWRESLRTGDGSSHMARVRALELVGQHLGVFPRPAGRRKGTKRN